MTLMSKKLRKELGKYNDDLRRRKLKVPCPHCGAKKGKMCFGVYGKPKKEVHWARSYAAKQAGFVDVSKGGR